MGKSSAPDYATTTLDSGLWGSSTNSKSGTSYNPASWMSNTMNTVGNNVNKTLSNMLSNDYANDPNFQAYQNQLNKTAKQNYDASVLSQLANRGLMRSSGLQSATNAFADTLADNTTNLYDNYYNRQTNNLSNLLNTSNNLYNYMSGLTGGALQTSNAVNNYEMQKAQLEAQQNAALYGALSNAIGTIGGAALAPATGGASLAGSALSALKK